MPRVPTRIDRYNLEGRLGSGGMGSSVPRPRHQPDHRQARRPQAPPRQLRLGRAQAPVRPRGAGARRTQSPEHRRHLRLRRIRRLAVHRDGVHAGRDAGRDHQAARSAPAGREARPAVRAVRRPGSCSRGRHHSPRHQAGQPRRGPERPPEILDFGIARVDADTTARDGQLTLVTARIGTPGYMSPEQLETGRSTPGATCLRWARWRTSSFRVARRLRARPPRRSSGR